MKSSNFGDFSLSRVEIMHRAPCLSGVNNAKLTFRGMKQQHCKINFTRVSGNCQIQSQLEMENLGKTLPAVSSSKTLQFASTPGALTWFS